MLRLLLKKAKLSFTLQIIDLEGEILVTMHRGWTFWMSKIKLTDNKGDLLGSIKQKFVLFKPTFKIYD